MPIGDDVGQRGGQDREDSLGNSGEEIPDARCMSTVERLVYKPREATSLMHEHRALANSCY